MALIINSNIAGLNGQRSLNRSSQSISKAFEALSSGQRINSAADDASGLAIASRLSAEIRSLNMAVRNANDGIGMVQTADAALGQATDIVGRMRELAVQASSGVLSASDRAAIGREFNGLKEDLDTVAATATFNGNRLLDGSLDSLQLQIGTSAGDTATLELGDVRAGSLGARATVAGAEVAAGAIAGGGDLTINGETIRGSLNLDDTSSTVDQASSAIAKAAAINASSATTGVTATADATVTAGGAVVGAGDLAAGEFIINGIDVGAVQGVQAGDGGGGLVAAINAVSDQTGVEATLSDTGELELTAEDGRNIDLDVNGGAAAVTGFAGDDVVRGGVTLSSSEAITVGGSNSAVAGLASATTQVDDVDVVDAADVSTSDGAQGSLATLDAALGQISAMQTSLGASHNRLVSTMENLSTARVNLASGRSRIQDADMAGQQADLVKSMLLQQVGVGMQAQANLSARVVLGLLA